MKILTGMQVGRNGQINWYSKWERLPTLGLAYYRQLQELNGRICEGQQQRVMNF
jgi:hypothetical protein